MADETMRLPERAEALLASFSTPDVDWEEQARAIEARLSGMERNGTEERWLEAPLPDSSPRASESEPRSSSASPRVAPAPPSAAPSLLALARSVAQKNARPEATDIARESLSAAAAARSQTNAIVERVRTSRSAPPPAPPPAELKRAVAAVAPAVSVSAQEARREVPPAPHGGAPSPAVAPARRGPLFATVGLAVAAAAALALFLRPGAEPAPAVPRDLPRAAAVAAEPPAEKPASPTPALAQAPQVSAPAASAEVVSPAAPTSEPIAAVAQAPAPSPGAPPSREMAKVASASRPAPAKVGSRPAPEQVVLEDSPPTSPGVPTAAQGLRPAAGSTLAGLPDRPGAGAVQAAIGSVLGAARSCVVGAAAPTPAQVVFGADGSVKSVTVSGPMAGTPAGACIESALKRARVAPFANPTFSLAVSVRP